MYMPDTEDIIPLIKKIPKLSVLFKKCQLEFAIKFIDCEI